MAKITLDTALTDYGAAKLNANFQKIANEFNNKVLYRDNPVGEPNTPTGDYDYNGKNLFNANEIRATKVIIGGVEVVAGNITSSALAQSLADVSDINKGDALLGVKSLLSGSVGTTQHQVNSERVTVFRFMTPAEIADVLSPTPVLDHTAAIDAALASGAKRVIAPAGRYRYSGNGINVPQGVVFEGEGVDYWDTYRPNPTKFQKSDTAGTHIYFVGTGVKNKTVGNISNYRVAKTVGGRSFPFTDFTNNDSTGGSPATLKAFSVGVTLNKDSQLRNMRLVPSFNLLSGYNNAALATLADDWDVGVWAKEANDCVVYNVQAVGYWRMAAWLLTENSGDFTDVGNSERVNFTKVMGQGRRGLLIRTAPQIPVVSNTTTTVTIKYNGSNRITATNQFKISGSAQLYTFTGYTVVGPDLQLTGVTPDLPGGLGVIRAPNIGNGVSASAFNDCLFASLDHTSGAASETFGIGQAAAIEADGYPLRSIAFNNTKWQTTYDFGNCLLGDIRDWKWSGSCQWENGAAIAYSNSEDQGYTENVRMEGEIGGSLDISAFTPRAAWIPFLQIPTQFADGSFTLKPWKSATPVRIQNYGGVNIVEARASDNNVRHKNGADFLFLESNGATNQSTLYGNNIVLANNAGTAIVTLFNTSLNATFAGNISPTTTASKSLGGSTARWLNGFINNLTLVPPASTTPADNGDMQFQLTSNTQLTIKVKGSDGVVRSANITLA